LKDRSQQKFKETFTSRSPSFVFLFGREKEEIKLGKQHVAYKNGGGCLLSLCHW